LYLALAGDFEPIPQYMQPDSMQLESSPPEYLQPQILQPQILPPQNLQDPAFQLELSPEIVLDE
jgi:hypothetical protein